MKENPNVILIEDLEKLQKTMDRYKMYKQFREEIPKDIVSIPEFITIEKEEDLLKASTIKFPLICKPFMACGKTGSHEMVITFTEDHLKSIFYDKLISIPFVGQRYINHHSTVHKVYVMGEKTVVKQKFSSKDVKIEKDSKLIQFDSQKEWPSILKTDATELYAPPNEKTVSIISNYLRNFLEMEFLGYDIITETETNLNYLIDVNYFPGYTGVKDFEIELMKYIKKRLKI